jgi:urea transport system permease protein
VKPSCPWVLLLGSFLWLGVAYAQAAETPAASSLSSLEQALARITSEDEAVREAALRVVIEQGDSTVISRLDEIRATADRPIRLAIKPVIDLLKNRAKLESSDSDVRRSAATDLGTSGRTVAIAWLEAAAAKETNKWVRYTMEESAALLKLAGEDDGARLLAKAARTSIERIETWGVWSSAIETVFRGISLSSILLIMSVGLAIVFGLMGVINMAHGELMMVGAYATFITQEMFRAFVPAALFDYYFAVAMPMAFSAAAGCGLLLEATVIRFLYGRPLETMLATWGISLVLMQAARVYFGDLTAVVAPAWLNGGVQVMVGVFLPNNRLFIIALSIICVLTIYAILFRSGIGLRVRAVTQNRNMSACLGIPTRKVDAYTFAFGSGLAGIAGWALTLIGNVEPGLGQNYIVDSFMVVVTGGVGKLAGTIVASLGIGGLNKLLEPSLGAVYGKVSILVLVILFLQWRPSGLFAIKGRHADS